jgi:signal transduction histidine kinase
VGNDGMIALYGTDQYLYVRKPLPQKLVGKKHNMPDILVDFITRSPDYSKTYRGASKVDGVERLLTVRKMNDYPLIVIVGFSVNELLANWKIKAAIHFIIVALVLGMFAYFLVNYFYSMEQLEEQRKQAIQSAKLSSLGEMAGGIAHEINNPLTIIGSHAKILKRSNTTNDPKINESLDKIIVTTNRIAKIIKGLRSFSRDSFNDPYAPTSIAKIVSSTLELCHEKLKTNSIILKVSVPEDLEANCQEIQIAQVLMNLISNSVDAIEFLDDKWIEISAYDINNQIKLIVTDSGNKIPDEISEKIMLPFFTTKEVGKGTGLGLSISKGIVESHNGKFYFDKKVEHTTFVIELPKAVQTKVA